MLRRLQSVLDALEAASSASVSTPKRTFLMCSTKWTKSPLRALMPLTSLCFRRCTKAYCSRWGEKGNDGGQFFTLREIIRAMVRAIDPKPGQTIYDPGCGTGGFLAQSYEYVTASLGDSATAKANEWQFDFTFRGMWDNGWWSEGSSSIHVGTNDYRGGSLTMTTYTPEPSTLSLIGLGQ